METRLVNLNPSWVNYHGDEKAFIGFDCPCGCEQRLAIPLVSGHTHMWNRVGEDFNTLTLTPSIQRTTECKTHFNVTNGNITP